MTNDGPTSDFWGEYISAHATPEPVIVKIFVEDDHCLAELKFLDDTLHVSREAVADSLLRREGEERRRGAGGRERRSSGCSTRSSARRA